MIYSFLYVHYIIIRYFNPQVIIQGLSRNAFEVPKNKFLDKIKNIVFKDFKI